MRFTKMHGLGNDYVYVDCFGQPPPPDPAAVARRVSDRHFGIGSDGLILICPSERADARMRMFNADGSEGEMCGNGIRCVGKYVYDHGIARKSPLRVEARQGVLSLTLDIADARVRRASVDMDEPRLRAADVPTTLGGDAVVDVAIPDWPLFQDLDRWLARYGAARRVTCVNTGNPHAVTYCADVQRFPVGVLVP